MESFIATQPIFDEKLQVMGYELLFRDSAENRFNGQDNHEATYQLVVNSCMTFGLDKLVGTHKAFFNFTEKHLQEGLAELLPPNQAVIEILETVRPSPEVLEVCRNLKNQGYVLALDDFVFHEAYLPLIEVADIIKVDFLQSQTLAERNLRRFIPRSSIKLLAEKVETREDFEQARQLGYKLFQGYFFHKPTVVSRKSIPLNQFSYLELLKKIKETSINLDELEAIVKGDVSLSYQLLKYINTPAFGFCQPIQSIRQAVSLLGSRKLLQWITLLVLREQAKDKPHELMRSAAIRARFSEKLAQTSGRGTLAPEAFLVGMFSLLDALLDFPLPRLLEELPLPAAVKVALAGQSGVLRDILDIVLTYEAGDWDRCLRLAGHLQLEEAQLVGCYLDAVDWLCVLEEVER